MNAVALDHDETIDFPPIQRALRPGFYRRADGEIFRVRLNRERTKVYTQQWTKRGAGFKLVYAPEAISTLMAADSLPLEQARTISREAGQCVVCAQFLSDAKSLAAGIGPKCAKNWERDELPGVVERTLRAIPASPKQSVRARVDGERLVITSQYDAAIVGIIKSFLGSKWNGVAWSMPLVRARELADAFAAAGIAYDDVAAIAMGWKG